MTNALAPLTVMVGDNGVVATMDEWARSGDHAVVLYDSAGRVVADYSWESLLPRTPNEPLPAATLSGVWWRPNSVALFGAGEDTFCLRLRGGTIFVFDLRTGREIIPNDPETKAKYTAAEREVNARLPGMTLRLLDSNSPEERKTGAILAGQLQLRQAIPKLKELLADKSAIITGSDFKRMREVFYVRKAAKEALVAMGVAVGAVVTEGETVDLHEAARGTAKTPQ